jgi:hypothetical protein
VCHALLRDATLYDVLFELDRDLAAQTRAAGCPCGGVLHSARYPRKPRGGLEDLGPAYTTRLSFCCAVEGCRRRVTPPSVRYLGRRVYLGAVVVLVTAMRAGITARRAAQLREWLGVSSRTLARWRRWWRETFVASAFWQEMKGRFAPPVAPHKLPASLLERFVADHVHARVVAVLKFLAPITTCPARRASRERGA